MEEALFPIAVMVNTIPVVAKAPILVLLLGNGMEPKIAIAAIICFFPTLVNMTRGLRDVQPEQLELMRVLSATPREVFFRIRVPNALPYLFSALQDRRLHGGDRRHRRRMDRLDPGHRRADHPVDLQFRFAAALRHHRRRLDLLGAVLLRDLAGRAAGASAGNRRRTTPEPTSQELSHDRNHAVSSASRRRACPSRAPSDVVVVGGGPAGIAAALAGARNGLERHAARALPLSRRPGLRRHGAGARRHVQRPRRSRCAASARS